MAQILQATDNNIHLLAKELKNGNIACFPTDTVYGVGASALSESAILKLFSYKNRPANNPLILHLYAKEQIEEHLIVNDSFYALLAIFMEGGLTLVLNKKENSKINILCSAGLKQQAFRIPKNETCLALLKEVQTPLVASSANISKQISPTRAEHVLENFKNSEVLILNDNKPLMGLESTILDISDENHISVLRYGAISIEQIEKLGIKVNINISLNSTKAYTPKTKVKLNTNKVEEFEGLLAFGKINFNIPMNVEVLNLSEEENLKEASKNLFDMLIKLDSMNLKKINIMPIPNIGLGVSINQRLLKLPKE